MTRLRPASPNWSRSSRSPHSRSRAARSSLTLFGLTTMPVRSCWLTQEVPVCNSVLITGWPQSIASSCTIPKASCRVTDGSTNTSHA